MTKSVRDKISGSLKGKPKSYEHKLKCGIATKGRHWIKNKESVKQTVATWKLNNSYCTNPKWL